MKDAILWEDDPRSLGNENIKIIGIGREPTKCTLSVESFSLISALRQIGTRNREIANMKDVYGWTLAHRAVAHHKTIAHRVLHTRIAANNGVLFLREDGCATDTVEDIVRRTLRRSS